MKFDPVKPTKRVHVRSSYYLCGLCGKQVARYRKTCGHCGVEVLWDSKELEEDGFRGNVECTKSRN